MYAQPISVKFNEFTSSDYEYRHTSQYKNPTNYTTYCNSLVPLRRKAGREGWKGRLEGKAGREGWKSWKGRLEGKAGREGWKGRLEGKAGREGWKGRLEELEGKAGNEANTVIGYKVSLYNIIAFHEFRRYAY